MDFDNSSNQAMVNFAESSASARLLSLLRRYHNRCDLLRSSDDDKDFLEDHVLRDVQAVNADVKVCGRTASL